MNKIHFFISLPLLFSILSCTSNGEKVHVWSFLNDTLIKETDFESHSKTKLSANEIASSNKKDTNEEEHVIGNNEYWWESDSVYATKMYEFNYADSIFPCQPPCIIKGLDTDGEGSFYIAGGNPIRLNCYKETELKWSRVISTDSCCTEGYLHLVGDSIYFIEESIQQILRIHKDGTGEIDRFNLHGFPTDHKIICGNYGIMTDDFYIVQTSDFPVRAYTFRYPAICVDSTIFKNQITLGISADSLEALRQNFETHIRIEDRTVHVHRKKGKCGGWIVYTSARKDADAFIDPECGEEPGTVITLSADTKDIWCFIQLPIGGLPPCNSKTGADSAGNTTGIVDAFRNGKLLFSGYDPHSQKFQIHEFFIDSVLEHATLHARYISGAGWGAKSPK